MENKETPMRIRPASEAELPQLARLETASFSQAWSETMLRDSLSRNSCLRALILEEADSPKAYLLAQELAPEAELLRLAVLPEARRRGLARSLLACWLEQAAEKGCTDFFLEVRTGNLPAKALYRKTGFRVIGRRPHYYEDSGEDAEIWGLKLESPPAAPPADR